MARSALRVSHLEGSPFLKRGLRGYFEYRDLGIKRATRGKLVAHVIRARPGKASHGEWHSHDCELQFVYVLKGWVLFEYEGVGQVMMKAGSCFYQPPKIKHREIRHSKNLEMIEIVGPATFKTRSVRQPNVASDVRQTRAALHVRQTRPALAAKPGARKSPARRSRG